MDTGSQEASKGAPSSDTQGLFDGFSGFVTATEADYDQAMSRGLVVVDTNVLLNLYRYNRPARENLFQVLEQLGDCLWFPHQVLLEFHRNRQDVIADLDVVAEQVADELLAHEQKALTSFRRWAKRVALSPDEEDSLREPFQSACNALRSGIEYLVAAERDELNIDTTRDTTLARLAGIVEGRRGAPLPRESYAAALVEARRRKEQKIPPGYRDADKDKGADAEGAAGDYLVWVQTMEEAERRTTDVLLVTGDVKPDWWRLEKGAAVGPRNELAEELLQRTGTRLFMLRPESLLFHARRVFGLEVPEETLTAIERLDRASQSSAEKGEQSDGAPWSARAVQLLLERLSLNAPVQAEVIRQGALSDGFVQRDRVYELGGFDLDRSLRGFTRPVTRITRELQVAGIVPYFARVPLEPVYDPQARGYSKAVGFHVDVDFAETLFRMQLPDELD